MKRDWSDVENTFTTVLILKTKKTNVYRIYNDTLMLACNVFYYYKNNTNFSEKSGKVWPDSDNKAKSLILQVFKRYRI